MNFNHDIFREYDIRGKYTIDYDTTFAKELGRSVVEFSKALLNSPLKIAVGIDARHSSSPLKDSLIEGLCFEGADVLDLGLVTSPISYFSCFNDDSVTGSIMITGSHNPPIDKKTLSADEIQHLKNILLNLPNEDTKTKGTLQSFDIITPYINRLAEEFSHLKPFSFVVDCGNGAAGSATRKAFKACNLEPLVLFEEPDGDFPNHHPDPTIEKNLVQMKEKLKSSDYELGIAYDGDADRIVVVTKEGRTIYSDELMSLFAKDVLQSHPNAKIIGDVKCSDEYYKLLKLWNAEPIMWKTGHSLIKKKVKEENSPFGGEFSGHIFFNDRYYGFDDALYCSLRLIEIIQKSGVDSLESLLSYYPKTICSPELRIEVGESKKHELVELYKEKIKEHAQSTNELDGVRSTFATGWTLVRASNTQPSITLRFEAQSDEELKSLISLSSKILNLDLHSYL